MESEPSLGKRPPGKIKIIDTINLSTYEPKQADIEKALGLTETVKNNEQSWTNWGSK
jgi:hypothetical protein